MTILDQLADYARERTRQAKQKIPLAEIRRQALALPKGEFAFEKAPRPCYTKMQIVLFG